ncbi:hypothetical protein SAMN02799636_00103 [Methylobacterium sp. 275MFSha3.1]|nr:hypothetical protein SAMN02799636_00103 [Methylobacterium sp. 275MFSha3.1]
MRSVQLDIPVDERSEYLYRVMDAGHCSVEWLWDPLFGARSRLTIQSSRV